MIFKKTLFGSPQMWQFMESHHSSVFVTSYEGGIARVKRGNYAFLMESTMLDYVVQVNISYCHKFV